MKTLRTIILFALLAMNVFSLRIEPSRASGATQAMTPPSPRPPATTVNVSIVDFAFEPGNVTVNVNDSVKWTHNGGTITLHTTTSDSGLWDSGDLTVGQNFSHTFTTTGYFPYHCTVHPLTMKGFVRVIAPTFITIVVNLY